MDCIKNYRYELTLASGDGLFRKSSKYNVCLTIDEVCEILREVKMRPFFKVNGSVFKSSEFYQLVNLETTILERND